MSLSAPFFRAPIGSSIVFTAPGGGYTAGQLIKIEDTVVVIMEAADAAAEVVGVVKCDNVYLPKDTTSGSTFAAGDKVYYYSGKVYNASLKPGGAVLCGIARNAQVAADTYMEVDFDGTLGIVS